MKLIIAAVILLGSSTCSKIENYTGSGIIGKWQLTESLISPGDMGVWTKADPNNPITISFSTTGTVNVMPSNQYDPIRYALTSDSTMLMYRTTDSLPYRYTVDGDKLTLYPPCIEPCAFKYKAIDFNR